MLTRHSAGEPRLGGPHRPRRDRGRGRGDAARAPARARRRVLRGRRSRRRVSSACWRPGSRCCSGFIVFLAFTSYDQSRSGAEQEALVVVQQVENAQFFPQPARAELTGELVCYGRSVVERRVGQDARRHAGRRDQPVGGRAVPDAADGAAEDRAPSSPPTTSGSTRPRRARRRAAIASTAPSGVIPATLWIVLFFIAAVIFVFMLFFADSGERAVVQGMLIGSVVSVMAALLLLLNALNKPFHGGVGGLQPVAMERSLRMIDEALGAVGPTCSCPATRAGSRCRRDDARRSTAPGSSSSRPCCSRSRPSRPRGAATSRRRWNGEQAKAAARANALRIELDQGGGAREQPDRDRRGDLHAVGQRLRPEPDGARRLLLRPLPQGVQACGRTHGSRRGRSRTRTLR